jgi:hypothetical protein
LDYLPKASPSKKTMDESQARMGKASRYPTYNSTTKAGATSAGGEANPVLPPSRIDNLIKEKNCP